MTLTLLLASWTIACLTYTVQMAVIFEGFRLWVNRVLGARGAVAKWILRGLQCPYCFAHWVGFVVVPLMAATWREAGLLLFPAIWLAVHWLNLYNLLLQVLPIIQAALQRKP